MGLEELGRKGLSIPGDLAGDAGHALHFFLREVLGVGVAGGIADLDAHAESEGHGLGGGLEDPFLEGVGAHGPVLEEEVGVVATVLEGDGDQSCTNVRVDGASCPWEEGCMVGRASHGAMSM